MTPITWLWIGAGILMAAFLVCAAVYALGVVTGIYKELKKSREAAASDRWWRMMNDK